MLSATKYFLFFVLSVVVALPPAYSQFTNPNDVDTTPAATSGTYDTQYGASYRSELIREIMPHLNDPVFQNAIWGVHVIDLNTGASLFSRNAQVSMVPASNTKLYTTAAALELLGTDFRYETRVWTNGSIQNGVLTGDLIVEGSGDPTISGRFNEDDRTKTFRDWAADLKSKGITRINGNIIGDDTIFDDVALGSSWSWDYTTYWYAAEMGGLSFNENCVDIEMIGTRPGEPATIKMYPNTSYAQLVNETLTVRRGEPTSTGYNRPWGTNRIHVSNKVVAGSTTTYSLAVTNTALYFVHVLKEVLQQEGIEINGDIFDRAGLPAVGDYKSTGNVLTTYISPTLEEIVYILNKRSQNLFAENLLKTMGVWYLSQQKNRNSGPYLASARDGHRAAWPVFGSAGVDTTRLNLADGSGMSRMNLVTPAMTTTLLKYMWHHPNDQVRTAFVQSLPRGGEEIGTLRTMFLRGPAAPTVAAKTGTLGFARALSGYVTAKDGTPLAFSIMVNHHTIGGTNTNRALESIVNELAEFSYN
jgi:D-alanyl-D-alanine carboxypeptidase/D-alanyl-D-alanine-endopeptidase (penicillin-binding protein 4)